MGEILEFQAPPRTKKKVVEQGADQKLKSAFENLISQVMSGKMSTGSLALPSSVEILDSETDLKIRFALPGFQAAQMKVFFGQNILKVSVYSLKDSLIGEHLFTQTVPIPHLIDEERISAELKEEILSVSLPRLAKAEANFREIEVQTEV